jgi:hypothetical protein
MKYFLLGILNLFLRSELDIVYNESEANFDNYIMEFALDEIYHSNDFPNLN